jgi:hypothetical protein
MKSLDAYELAYVHIVETSQTLPQWASTTSVATLRDICYIGTGRACLRQEKW